MAVGQFFPFLRFILAALKTWMCLARPWNLFAAPQQVHRGSFRHVFGLIYRCQAHTPFWLILVNHINCQLGLNKFFSADPVDIYVLPYWFSYLSGRRVGRKLLWLGVFMNFFLHRYILITRFIHTIFRKTLEFYQKRFLLL